MFEYFDECEFECEQLSDSRKSRITASVLSQIKEERPMKKHIKIKPLIIAAAVAVLAAATAITAGAIMRAPINVEMNNEPYDVEYDVYTDEYGNKIETFVYDIPEYALAEELEGLTAVGKVRAVYDPGSIRNVKYKLVDEAGNEFVAGINNKMVNLRINDNNISRIGFSCANVADGYTVMEFNFNHSHNEFDLDKCIHVVKEEETDDIMREHGYELSTPRYKIVLGGPHWSFNRKPTRREIIITDEDLETSKKVVQVVECIEGADSTTVVLYTFEEYFELYPDTVVGYVEDITDDNGETVQVYTPYEEAPAEE